MERMNIYQKMSAITTELSTIAKNLTVGEGRSSYKAVGEADVLAAVRPLEAKYGVYSYPMSRKVIDSDILSSTSTYNGNTKTVNKLYMRLETVYRFINTENPTEFVDITTYGDGIDANDKAPGKAMTYGDKYALLKAYKAVTGDDPDQTKSDETTINRGPKRGENETSALCADCGKYITDGRRSNGAVWPAADVARYTMRMYGRHLCVECGKKAKANAGA
jgi:hypothetical protein